MAVVCGGDVVRVHIRGYTWIYVDRHSYWHVDICSVMRKLQRMATNIAYSGHVGQAVYYSGYKSSLLKLLQCVHVVSLHRAERRGARVIEIVSHPRSTDAYTIHPRLCKAWNPIT